MPLLPTVAQNNLPDVLKEFRKRIRALEAAKPPSSVVVVHQGTYTGTNVTIPPGLADGAYLPWAFENGTPLLDVTTADHPAVTLDGLWRITVPVTVFGGGMSPGDCYTALPRLLGVYDGLGNGIVNGNTFTMDSLGALADGEQIVTVTAEAIMRAGDLLDVFVFHENAASLDQTFRIGIDPIETVATVTYQEMDMSGIGS